eukprot:gene1904-2588_t
MPGVFVGMDADMGGNVAFGLGNGNPEPVGIFQKCANAVVAFYKVLNMPIKCGLVALVLGYTPVAQLLVPKDAALRPIMDGLESLGAAFSPCATLGLAGRFMASYMQRNEEAADSPSTSEEGIVAATFWVSFFKLIVSPIVGVLMLQGFAMAGLLPVNNMLLMLVLLIECCMPTAQNLVLLLQVQGQMKATNFAARIMLSQYLLSTVTITVFLTIFLNIVINGVV